jgi:hypothetical protein
VTLNPEYQVYLGLPLKRRSAVCRDQTGGPYRSD